MNKNNNNINNLISDWRFNLLKAEGSFLFDQAGNRLIDFTSGWNVTNLGWNHPEVAEVIKKQADKNVYAPMWCADPVQIEYAEALTKALPESLTQVVRATGGTEANEEAIKIARAYTKRPNIIGFEGTYHGQSYATIALCKPYESKVIQAISPMPPGFIQIDYPSVRSTDINHEEILDKFSDNLEKILKNEDVAAIMTEAGIVTGGGSTAIAPNGFLKRVRELTKKYGTLLILDEVGTGFSRCGKLFGMELENIVPDIVTFAKGISNGAFALGVAITTKEIAEKTFDRTGLISTFGWTPLGCAVCLEVLKIHLRDRVWEKADNNGKYILAKLNEELRNNQDIVDINGKGMEIGVHMKEKKALRVVEGSQKNGLHIVYDLDSNIQLMPPLTIDKKTLDEGLDILISELNKI